MGSRIEHITPEQEARFPEFIERWTRIGLCTERADRPRAERAIVMAYKIAGLEPPKRIVWCGSPLSQGLTRVIVLGLEGSTGASVGDSIWDSVGDSVRASVGDSIWDSVGDSVRASVGDSVRDSVRDSIWDSVWASVGDSVRASVWASVGDSVRDSIWDSVRASVWASVRDSVWASVGDSVRTSIWDSVRASVRTSVGDSGYGQHDVGWLAFYDYFAAVCGLDEQTRKLSALWELAKSANWWLPHQKICWVSERHNILNRDDIGWLHCESGPALAYPDGWVIYAINGVRVDEQVIMRPATQTIEQIRKEANLEIKRVRIERYGWERYLKATKAVVIDQRRNDIEATDEALMRGADGETVMVCACPSTGRTYSLQCPSVINTCEAAQNWISGGLSTRIINVA